MTELNDAEITLLAERAVSVVHCPESNLKLASGFCPVARLLAAGVNVALGTDGAASNNDLDMFGELRAAALLGKAVARDASAVPAETALAMATLHGARALGLADDIGSLTPGKLADLICVDLDAPATQPVHHVISQLVYSVCREQVSDVWVGGRQLLALGRPLHMDESEILARAAAWHQRLGNADGCASPTSRSARRWPAAIVWISAVEQDSSRKPLRVPVPTSPARIWPRTHSPWPGCTSARAAFPVSATASPRPRTSPNRSRAPST
jgi:5-methylthioadenosine/S-adenosylhomocysteine deaminase